ncbi:MAG: hypothetical protein AVDCRST_MAG67-3801, partial [uncultured Solirubrobacteraceae bacterium]
GRRRQRRDRWRAHPVRRRHLDGAGARACARARGAV